MKKFLRINRQRFRVRSCIQWRRHIRDGSNCQIADTNSALRMFLWRMIWAMLLLQPANRTNLADLDPSPNRARMLIKSIDSNMEIIILTGSHHRSMMMSRSRARTSRIKNTKLPNTKMALLIQLMGQMDLMVTGIPGASPPVSSNGHKTSLISKSSKT